MESVPEWTSASSVNQPAILDHVRAHLDPSGCGLLPGGAELPGEDQADNDSIRWVAGARDGVLGHHVGRGEPEVAVADLIALMGQCVAGGLSPVKFGALYERLRSGAALQMVDELLSAVQTSALPRSGVAEMGRRLAGTGRHAEPVKVGIALIGITGGRADRDLLLTLGRHEEFTLYCAVAIRNCEPEPDPVLWSLAQGVDGWGRIGVVERLEATKDEEIRDWILRHGFRNSIMYEYLAWIAATTGRLCQRLAAADPDDELLDAASDIISALIMGGPARDIDDYEDAPALLDRYVTLMTARAERLTQFLVIDEIAGFLRRNGEWDERYQHNWTAQERSGLLTRCAEIAARPLWPVLTADGLQSDDNQTFRTAARAARVLNIDAFDPHWRRVLASPVATNWYAVMKLANEQRIDQIIEFATAVLVPRVLATGPTERVFMGQDNAADQSLSFLLQDLDRFPGKGWDLVRAGLSSPFVRVRNTAVKALGGWPLSQWPPQAAEVLRAAALAEPNERTRKAMTDELGRLST